ncbi:MAG: DUF1330 domain-containing protein [Gammaproteobacteria bacterium]
MSRGLRWFLIFCAVLLAGGLALALYLGPNVLFFLFHDERDAEPFVLVSFVDLTSETSREEYRDAYQRPVLSMVADLGGAALWEGAVRRVIEGRPDDRWDVLMLVRYPSRKSFVSLVTSSQYRGVTGARAQAVRRSAVLAATPVEGYSPGEHGTLALLLHRFVDDQARDVYFDEFFTDVLESAHAFGGAMVWHATTNPLETDPHFAWTDLVMIGFPGEPELAEWAREPMWRSRQALARRLMERWALLELESTTP